MAEKIKRIPTGITHFDKEIENGFVGDSSVVLCGPPGVGKTIFSLQFLYNGATKYNEPGLYVSIGQKGKELKEQASRFNWDFEGLEKKKKISFFEIPIDVSEFDIVGAIQKEATKIKARRIIIDSLSMLAINASMYDISCKTKKTATTFGKLSAIKSLPLRDIIKQFIYIFISRIKDLDTTTLFIGESPVGGSAEVGKEFGGLHEYYTRDTVSEFTCDGVVTFHIMYSGIGAYDRGIRIVKMRSTKHKITKEPIPMKIGDNGIELKGTV